MKNTTEAMVMDKKVLDELVKGKSAEEVFGKGGVLKQLVKAMTERLMEAEMAHHVGYTRITFCIYIGIWLRQDETLARCHHCQHTAIW